MDEIVSRDDIRAALGARQDLGPEMEDAVVESFVDKVEQAINRRTAAVPAVPPAPVAPVQAHPGMSLALGISLVVMGAGMVPAILALAPGAAGVGVLVAMWSMIVLVNVIFNGGFRRR